LWDRDAEAWDNDQARAETDELKTGSKSARGRGSIAAASLLRRSLQPIAEGAVDN